MSKRNDDDSETGYTSKRRSVYDKDTISTETGMKRREETTTSLKAISFTS